MIFQPLATYTKPKRRYCRLSPEQKAMIREQFRRARRGEKGELAKRLSGQIGCSSQWVIKVALYTKSIPLETSHDMAR